jgi:hypothetical protein
MAAEGTEVTLGTTEDTGGGRQGAMAAHGGGRREHGGRQDGRREAVRESKDFGLEPRFPSVWKESKRNQTNTINYLNQIKPLKASNYLSPIQIGPI